MTRTAVIVLALALLTAPARAQTPPGPRPATPAPTGTPATTTSSSPGASVVPQAVVPPQLPGVALPTDTTIPAVHTIGYIRLGQTRAGILEDGDYRMGDGTWCDIWYFDGTVGQRVVIELHSRAFDAYLQLLDPAGTKLAEDTDAAGNHDSRITFTLRETGRHQIVVNNETDDVKTGPYTLILRQP